MEGPGEELSAEPLQLGRRTRNVLGVGVGAGVVVCLSLLTTSPHIECASPTGAPSAGSSPSTPWLASDDPLVLAMHYGLLDRRRSPVDAPPKDVLSADVAQTARKVGGDAGVAVYLADGPGFVCLGVDGRRAGYGVAHQCMLDVSVANQGLSVNITSIDDKSSTADPIHALDTGSVLVVAVPDHAQLLTQPSTTRLATYANASVFRPGEDEIVLQQQGQSPVVINRTSSTTLTAGC